MFERHITVHTATFIHLPMSQAYGRCIPGLQLQRNTRSSLTILNEVTLKLVQVTENTDLTHWYFIHQGISQVHKMLSALHTTYKACSYIHACTPLFICLNAQIAGPEKKTARQLCWLGEK